MSSKITTSHEISKMNSLQKLITKNNLNAELISFNASTHTVEDAVVVLNCKISQIIKSLIVITRHENDLETPILVLVPGHQKLKQILVRKLLKKYGILLRDSRLASPEEVKKFSGYEIGGVPPLILDMKVIISEEILSESFVYGGGGSSSILLKISVKDLLKF